MSSTTADSSTDRGSPQRRIFRVFTVGSWFPEEYGFVSKRVTEIFWMEMPSTSNLSRLSWLLTFMRHKFLSSCKQCKAFPITSVTRYMSMKSVTRLLSQHCTSESFRYNGLNVLSLTWSVMMTSSQVAGFSKDRHNRSRDNYSPRMYRSAMNKKVFKQFFLQIMQNIQLYTV